MHQRNPSITPTIGFKEYSRRHCSGTTFELNPTGEMYRPNCTMNGMTYRKSRYLTLRTVIQSAGPRLARKPIATNSGKSSICQPGRNWYHAIKASAMAKLMRKSTKDTTTAAVGMISLGKYTLLIRFVLLTRLFEASSSAEEKKVQGSIPAMTISA